MLAVQVEVQLGLDWKCIEADQCCCCAPRRRTPFNSQPRKAQQTANLCVFVYACAVQAVLTLFNGQIRKAVQSGIQSALQKDVPDGVNKVLSTLPTHLEVKGLPFNVGFEYSLFTLTYVLLQGYGEIASEAKSKPAQATGHPALVHMQQCPFDVTPLPLSPQQVGAESHMLSIYLHHSVANCMLWGLYNAGSLQMVVKDGTVPKLHLTTDLLAMLIPELPKKFPHQSLRIEVAATKEPLINFSSDKGIQLQAVYQTEIYVENATLHDPLVTRLLAEVTVEADMSWESTIITSATAKHTVQQAIMAVPTPQWDMTVAWFIQNYAGLYPLRQLVTTFVHTPVSSMLDLTDTESRTYEGWYSLAAEVAVTGLPTQ
ncbi:bactericidal permeability-increasing protein [Dunaliella salina]|uniref:Bactericidal permeability-increasing protein n=1 Tax=Dunaliella salina TaxID=3046 RepID=A0ABQ7H201_DUNSA|nr:bactericidal permeability-increasing protein [Dunaliella salina]|eukprot:KAF5840860.1 bactericidal permeability-increasing protein [Dunaliella salina]